MFERTLKEDLGVTSKQIFRDVDEHPVGCASLAQVHHGHLVTGEEVAIKIQYPTVARNTQTDLRNIELATQICERIFPRFQYSVGDSNRSQRQWIVPKIRSTVENEFNFTNEAKNLEDCRAFFADNPSVYVPKPYLQYCTKRIVVMEYIHGTKISDVAALDRQGFDRAEIGRICVAAFSDMIFRFHKLHMDPHSGNLMVRRIPGTQKPQLVILDHGMYMYFREGFNENFRKLWLAMISQDKAAIVESSKAWGLEREAELLPMIFTGRTTRMHNKLGEELSEEEIQQIRMKMIERMHHTDKEKLEQRMKRVQEFAKSLPLELFSVMRVQLMVRSVETDEG